MATQRQNILRRMTSAAKSAKPWLCFTAESANSTIRLDKVNSPDPVQLETSTDGSTWTEYTWSGNTGATIILASIGDKVYWRATTENATLSQDPNVNYYNFVESLQSRYAVSGNLLSLLDRNCKTTIIPQSAFARLFQSSSYVTSPYTEFSADLIPAAEVNVAGLQFVFIRCGNARSFPKLTSFSLNSASLYGAFSSSSIREIELGDATPKGNCYNYLLQGCGSINHIKVSFTSWKISGNQAFTTGWCQDYGGVTFPQTGTFECPSELPSTRGVSAIPEGWTILKRGYFNSANGVFYNDKDFTSPAVVVESLTNDEYYIDIPTGDIYAYSGTSMENISLDYLAFTANEAGSTVHLGGSNDTSTISLEYSTDKINWSPYIEEYGVFPTITLSNIGDKIYMRATSVNATFSDDEYNPYQFVLSGSVAASGNIMSLLDKTCKRMDVPDNAFISLFEGQSALTSAPTLPATSVGNISYQDLFSGCTSLISAPELPATSLSYGSYYGMFHGCTSLVYPPSIIPARTIPYWCCYGMFSGCTSLISAPFLPATRLEGDTYNSMFDGCTQLREVRVSFTDWGNQYDTDDWLRGVADNGTFYCPAALATIRDESHIPAGWTIITH